MPQQRSKISSAVTKTQHSQINDFLFKKKLNDMLILNVKWVKIAKRAVKAEQGKMTCFNQIQHLSMI